MNSQLKAVHLAPNGSGVKALQALHVRRIDPCACLRSSEAPEDDDDREQAITYLEQVGRPACGPRVCSSDCPGGPLDGRMSYGGLCT